MKKETSALCMSINAVLSITLDEVSVGEFGYLQKKAFERFFKL